MGPEEMLDYYKCRARTLATENHELHLMLSRARVKNRAHKKNIRSMQRKLELYEMQLKVLRAERKASHAEVVHSR